MACCAWWTKLVGWWKGAEPLPDAEDLKAYTDQNGNHNAATAALRLTAEKQRYELWAKQEDIAMHFNDLTMRLRLQALAGIGAAVVAAGTVFSHEGEIKLTPIGWFLYALAAIWFGIFLLDHYYYQALLKGAVKSILELEKKSADIRLSSRVEQSVGRWGVFMRVVFYGIVLALLVHGGRWCIREKTIELVAKKPTASDSTPTPIPGGTNAGASLQPDAGR